MKTIKHLATVISLMVFLLISINTIAQNKGIEIPPEGNSTIPLETCVPSADYISNMKYDKNMEDFITYTKKISLTSKKGKKLDGVITVTLYKFKVVAISVPDNAIGAFELKAVKYCSHCYGQGYNEWEYAGCMADCAAQAISDWWEAL